jgi:hypothetical protein
MNLEEAKHEVKSMTDKDLQTKFDACMKNIKEGGDKAKPILDEARKLQAEGQEILKTVESDRVMAHAIMQTQKERRNADPA